MLNKSIKLFTNYLSHSEENIDLKHYYKIIFSYLFFFLIFYIIIDFFFLRDELENPRAWDFLVSRVPSKVDIFIFIISFTIIPIISYKYFNFCLKNERYFIYIFISVNSLSILLFTEILLYQFGIKIALINSLSIFCCSLAGIFSFFLPVDLQRVRTRWLEIFLILCLLNIIFYKPFFRFESSENMNFYLDLIKSDFFLIKFISLIFFISIFLFLLGKYQFNTIPKKYLLIFIPTFIFLSIDLDLYSIDLHHYIPYLGPSLAINQGNLLGVDVFSQYGMGLSYIGSIYFKFAPNTFFSFGILIRIINFLSYVSIILILLRISDNRLLALVGGLIIIIFHFSTMGNNMNAFPSTFGSRYLLPLLITFIISKENYYKNKLDIYLISVLYSFSSLWSLECFIYANALIFGNIFAKLIFYQSIKNYFFLLRSLFIILLIFHLSINIYYYVIFGSYLDYYMLSLITVKAGVISNAPQMKDFLGWIPFLIGYSLIFIKYLDYVCKKNKDTRDSLKFDIDFDKFTSSYLNLAILGVIIGIYYVNRSVPLALYFLYFPLMIIIYKTLEVVLPTFVLKKNLFLFSTTVILLAFLLTNNFNKLINMRHPNEINKFKFVSNCLKFECELKNYVFSKKKLVSTNFFETDFPESMMIYKEILNEGIYFKKKYFSNSNKDLIFISVDHIPLSEMLFIQTNSWYFHPISWIFSDSTVLSLKEKIINFNENIKENQNIMFLDSDRLHHFEKEIVGSIKKKWNLCLLEKGFNKVSVYKLINIKKECNV